MMHRRPRIAIIHLGAVGEVIAASAVPCALREHYPGAFIAWVCGTAAADALRGHPALDAVLVADAPATNGAERRAGGTSFRGTLQLLREVRRGKFDLALDLHGLAGSAILARASGAPVRIGWAGAPGGATLSYTAKVRRNPDVGRLGAHYLQILSALELEAENCELRLTVTSEERGAAAEFLALYGLTAGGYAAIAPVGAGGKAYWEDARWVELMHAIRRRYDLHSVMVGEGADMGIVKRILARCGRHPPAVAIGALPFKGIAALLEMSRLLITGDTALLPIALALRVPTAAILWSGLARRVSREPRLAIVTHDVSCAPCKRARRCSDLRCVDDAVVEEALLAIAGLCDSPQRAWPRG